MVIKANLWWLDKFNFLSPKICLEVIYPEKSLVSYTDILLYSIVSCHLKTNAKSCFSNHFLWRTMVKLPVFILQGFHGKVTECFHCCCQLFKAIPIVISFLSKEMNENVVLDSLNKPSSDLDTNKFIRENK